MKHFQTEIQFWQLAQIFVSRFICFASSDIEIIFSLEPSIVTISFKISIFTIAGDFIDDIYHNDNKGHEFWDMRTYNDQYIAYGLYVFVVKLPDGQQSVGKFLVIK